MKKSVRREETLRIFKDKGLKISRWQLVSMSPGHASASSSASSSDHNLYNLHHEAFMPECFLCPSIICILTYWFILLFSQILSFHSKSNSNVFFTLLVRLDFFFFFSKNSLSDCWIVLWDKGSSSIASACNAQLVFTWVYIIFFSFQTVYSFHFVELTIQQHRLSVLLARTSILFNITKISP